MRRIILFFVPALLSVPLSHAAPLTWETFDLKGCRRWSITQDTQSGEQFTNAQTLADQLNHVDWKKNNRPDLISGKAYPDDIPIWQPVEAFSVFEARESIYGVCKLDWPASISCASTPNFPLAGTTYISISGPEHAPIYECKSGCEARKPRILYQLGYESEDSIDYEIAYKEYRRRCHEEKKKRSFFNKK